MKTIVIIALSLLAPLSAALACSPPLGWQDEGFYALGQRWNDVTPLPHGRFLVLQNMAFDLPTFDVIERALTVAVTDADDNEIPGQLEPSAVPGILRWVPETPLALGPGHLTTRVATEWGGETVVEMDFVVEDHPAATGEAGAAFEAEKFEHQVFGQCVEFSEDSCGEFCNESELIRTEMRFQVTVNMTLPEGPWSDARAFRTAIGTTAGEALAILDRTPFQQGADAIVFHGAAYPTWPHPIACAAVEVREVDGTVLLREADCFDLPEDESLSRDVKARLDEQTPRVEDPQDPQQDPVPEARSNAEGCQSAPGGFGVWWLALLALGLCRRVR